MNGSGRFKELSDLKFRLLAFVPLLYRPQVSDNPRVDLGLLITAGAHLLYAFEIPVRGTYAEGRGEGEIWKPKACDDLFDERLQGFRVIYLLSQVDV